MTIQAYTSDRKPQLAELLTAYFLEISDDLSEDIIREKLTDFIHQQHQKGVISISFVLDGTASAGFSIYQIDTPESDWCKRPGWGFIREFYITPYARRQGFGSQLAAHTQQRLQEMGAAKLYLTSDPAALAFWQNQGWRYTDDLCSNGLHYLEK